LKVRARSNFVSFFWSESLSRDQQAVRQEIRKEEIEGWRADLCRLDFESSSSSDGELRLFDLAELSPLISQLKTGANDQQSSSFLVEGRSNKPRIIGLLV
jgi:hypothetical protein